MVVVMVESSVGLMVVDLAFLWEVLMAVPLVDHSAVR